MPHWKSIEIERFRRLSALRLDGLGTVNLLVGRNNSGKTSLLEALAIASNPTSATQWIDVGRERELKSARTPVLEVLGWFFPHDHPRENGYEGNASIRGTLSDGRTLAIRAEYKEFRKVQLLPETFEGGEPPEEETSEYAATLEVWVKNDPKETLLDEMPVIHEFSGSSFRDTGGGNRLLPCQLVTPVSHRTSRQLLAAVDQVLEERRKSQVIDLMRKLSPDVSDIEIRSPEGRGAVVHLFHDGIGHIPLSVEGDGMRRALAFASASALARNGVLLVDEIETALHPEALAGIFRFLVEVCRSTDVQLFVTTHSLEAIDAMLGSMAGDLDDLVAYRLPPRESELPIKRFGGKTLHDLRHEGGLDLR